LSYKDKIPYQTLLSPGPTFYHFEYALCHSSASADFWNGNEPSRDDRKLRSDLKSGKGRTPMHTPGKGQVQLPMMSVHNKKKTRLQD
jgi:hypothetical protein